MDFSQKCSIYNDMLPVWKFCRDVINGSDSVKKARQLYLPKPAGMEDDEYEAFVTRGEFFPATGRTLEGIHGMLWSKPLRTDIPEQFEEYLKNVDGEGNDLNHFANDMTWDAAQTGFGGILVDAPSAEGLSQREAEEEHSASYMQYYIAESIINWDYDTKGRRKYLSYVILEEKEFVPTEINKFVKKEKKFYRILEIDDEGYYKHSRYSEDGTMLFETYPKKNGERMTEIPFFFIPSSKPYKPMMKDIADVNIAWWRKSADLENALHWIGVPTPIAIGYTPETKYDDEGNEIPAQKIRLGGNHVIFFPEGTSHVGYLELSGNGLSHLRTAMEDDEERMAILGVRIISQEKKGVESAETARIHRAGENSVIATFANECSLGLSRALKCYLEWRTNTVIDEEISVQINTDYDLSRMTPAELTAMVSLWQSGGISTKIMFENLKQGEIIPDGQDYDEMQKEIEDEREKRMAEMMLPQPTEE